MTREELVNNAVLLKVIKKDKVFLNVLTGRKLKVVHVYMQPIDDADSWRVDLETYSTKSKRSLPIQMTMEQLAEYMSIKPDGTYKLLKPIN